MKEIEYLRLLSFVAVFIVLALLERFIPYRKGVQDKLKRWSLNLSLSFVFNLHFKLIVPVTLATYSFYCVENSLGLFNIPYFQPFPNIALAFTQIYILDFAIYLQHRIFHWVPWLWRLHKVHHTDTEMDLTTGVRFHPLELLLSLGYKFLLVRLLGIDPFTIVLFEALLSTSSLFEHSNIKLHRYLDAVIRTFIVTPQMHFIHHSTDKKQQNKNFGFNFSIWDRMFMSYCGDDADKVTLGVEGEESKESFLSLLKLPFT